MNYLRTFAPRVTKLQKFNQKIISKAERYNEKFKGTFVETWIKYWKHLYLDYRDVAIDVRHQTKEKPWKVAGYLTTLATLWMFAKNNPDEISFRDAVLDTANQLILVNPKMQKDSSLQHLRLLEKCYNTNSIRYTSFGIFSVMWVDSYSGESGMYASQCEYLQVSYLKFFRRVIDFGFMNKWWLLEKHLEDFDINY